MVSESLPLCATAPRKVTYLSSFCLALIDDIFFHVQESDIVSIPRVEKNNSSILLAFGVFRSRFLFSFIISNRSFKYLCHPRSAIFHTSSSFFVELISFATCFFNSFGSKSAELTLSTIKPKASEARSSQYASQKAVISTIADLFKTSNPYLLPFKSPPTAECNSRRRVMSTTLASKDFFASLSIGLGPATLVAEMCLLCRIYNLNRGFSAKRQS